MRCRATLRSAFIHLSTTFIFLSAMISMLNPARLGKNCGFVVDWRTCSNRKLSVRQLTLPQARGDGFFEPIWLRPKSEEPVAWLFRVTLGALLALVSIVVILTVLVEALQQREVQNGLVAIGILLIGCWFLWTWLPHWLRDMIRKALRRKEHRNER